MIIGLPFVAGAQSPWNAAYNVQMWLRADNPHNNGSLPNHEANLTSWVDVVNGVTFEATSTVGPPSMSYNGMNFQPAVYFSAKRLSTAGNFSTNASNKYMTVFVLRNDVIRSAGSFFNYRTDASYDEGWHNIAEYLFFSNGSGTNRNPGLGGKHYGIIVIDRSGFAWHNGLKSAAGTARQLNNGDGRLTIGCKTAVGTTSNYFTGNIHEMIMLTVPSSGSFADADIQKINSYLAIKYGQTLESGAQYFSSGGTVIWGGSGSHSGYTGNVFGIARDDATALYQKQSVSYEDPTLTLFLGSTGSPTQLNSQNTGTFAADNTYLIVGSNQQTGLVSYTPGTTYANGVQPAPGTLNVRQKRVYKAQLTGGTADSLLVNMQLQGMKAQYVAVSSSAAFPAAQTRLYPVNSGVAANVAVRTNEYIGLLLFERMPGGINSDNVQTEIWLRADEVSNGSYIPNNANVTRWENIVDPTLDFEKNPLLGKTPVFRYGGMNFQPAVEFTNSGAATGITAVNACGMSSVRTYQIYAPATRLYRTFYVSRSRMTNGRGALFAFNTYFSEGWGSSNDEYLYYAAESGSSNITATNIGMTKRYGITSYERSSNAVWLNGKKATGSARPIVAANNKATLGTGVGNATYDPAYGRTFAGDIQEVIVLSTPNTGTFADAEMNKITSYLAIKYGQTLEGTFTLVNSAGETLWNSSGTEVNYSNHVFAIGRDDASGLNQKQSTNVDNDQLTVFLGNTLQTLSAQNTGSFAVDKTFLLFGSNAANGLTPFGTEMRQTRIYKTKLVTTSVDSVRVSLQVKGIRAKSVLVSNTDAFTPGVGTRRYPVIGGVAHNVAFKGNEFVSFIVDQDASPGGTVGTGLTTKLWLKADDVQAGEQPTDATTLTRWSGHTGLYHDAVQYGNATAPLYKAPAPSYMTDGMNYHPAVRFNSQHLKAENNLAFTSGATGYYAFYVSKLNPSVTSGNHALMSYANAPTTSMDEGWGTAANYFYAAPAGGGATGVNPGLNIRYGIMTTNRTGSNISFRHNARQAVSTTSATYVLNSTYPTYLGAKVTGNVGVSNLLNGDLQEVILLEEASGASGAADRILSIHTYLAVKYGQTLDTVQAPQWKNTAGAVIWDRNTHTGYNKNIFGIGRDDATGLYQKQSTSVGSKEKITVFLGNDPKPAALNLHNTGTLTNGHFVMFGSNGTVSGNDNRVSYHHIKGTLFMYNVHSEIDLKYRHVTMLQAQVTGLVPAPQVHFHVGGLKADYLLVSTDPTFPPASTHIHRVNANLVAFGVPVSTGDYIGFAYDEKAPGGVDADLRMWLKADEPSTIDLLNGEVAEWRDFSANTDNVRYNLRTAKASGDPDGTVNISAQTRPAFMQVAPGMNFHPSVHFRKLREYLSTERAAFSVAHPSKYTIITAINMDDFGAQEGGGHNASYYIAFGATTVGNTDNGSHLNRAPALGVRMLPGASNKGAARAINNAGTAINSGVGVYNRRATSILLYEIYKGTSSTDYYVRFEADGYAHQMNSGYNDGTNDNNLVAFRSNASYMNTRGTLGGGSRSERNVIGTISEVIAYERDLTADEKNKAYSYLGLKYGITIDLDKSNAAVNYEYKLSDGQSVWPGNTSPYSGYHNNVAAIVRDDAAALSNMQSHSTDSASTVLMGIGERLGAEPSLTGLDTDKEWIVWGNNGKAFTTDNFTVVNPEDGCGEMQKILNQRIWMVEVKTQQNYPVRIAAYNYRNMPNGFPWDGSGYQVWMMIAESEADIQQRRWIKVLTGTYVDGMHQFNYTFEKNKKYYFTFGGTELASSCETCDVSEYLNRILFRTNNWRNGATTGHYTLNGSDMQAHVNIGFEPGAGTVRFINSAPRAVTGDALHLWRDGTAQRTLTTHVTLDKAAIPIFDVRRIDYVNGLYAEVDIYGLCGGQIVRPHLSYAHTPEANASFTITGGIAYAKKMGPLSDGDRRGWMNVAFEDAVSEIFIKHRSTGRATGNKPFLLGPMEFLCPAPPPPVNEDGLSFSLQATPREAYTCQVVTYTFRIQNVNCTSKKVKLIAPLESGMKWVPGSLNASAANIAGATVTYGNMPDLVIDSLTVDGSGTTTFSARAYFDDSAQDDKAYSNWANVSYRRSDGTDVTLYSCDRLSPGCAATTVYALPTGDRPEPLEVSGPAFKNNAGASKTCYQARDTIVVSFTLRNPNLLTAIAQAALDVRYNDEFTLIPGSFSSTLSGTGSPQLYTVGGGFELTGAGGTGFTIPAGGISHTVSFKLIAPATLVQDYDESSNPMFDACGGPIGVPFGLSFDFISLSADECAAAVFRNAYGSLDVPSLPTLTITGPKTLCIGETSQVLYCSGASLLSADPLVATINPSTGVITAEGAGKTVFYFTSVEGCVAVSDTLTVTSPGISGPNALCSGSQITLSVVSGESGTWSSSNGGVATVNTSGVVTGVSAGTATITFTNNAGCQATHSVTVSSLPDVIIRGTISDITSSGVSVTVKAGIINRGYATMNAPVYLTLYRDSVSPTRIIITGFENTPILPGDTAYVTVTIPNITTIEMVHLTARVNDDGTTFPYYAECDTSNNVWTILHPSIKALMTKDATLNGIPDNGEYANPVSVFGSEQIEYKVIGRNVNTVAGKVVIRDTLPAYLEYVSGSAVPSLSVPFATTPGNPPRDILYWEFLSVAPNALVDVAYRATPVSGVCASQPLFANRAYITVSDTIHVETNDTYHQGAGVSLVTFSASLGGSLYNAAPQAIDYRTSPHAGVVVAPEAGYRFAGWMHDAYTSLRAVPVPARSGVMHLDTLTVYGDVELRAVFELEEYPVRYYLNSGANGAGNPSVYTVASDAITLSPAFREDDVFTGWTGSNGEEPQQKVTIAGGSTGALHFYANYLYNGREVEPAGFFSSENEDKVWAYKGDLYVRTVRPGSVVRIYAADGVLQKIQTLLTAGETKIGLPFGIYVVTLNNGVGRKVIVDL